jgi:hypothetical protein
MCPQIWSLPRLGTNASTRYHPKVEGVSTAGLNVDDNKLSPSLKGDGAKVGLLTAGLGVKG